MGEEIEEDKCWVVCTKQKRYSIEQIEPDSDQPDASVNRLRNTPRDIFQFSHGGGKLRMCEQNEYEQLLRVMRAIWLDSEEERPYRR